MGQIESGLVQLSACTAGQPTALLLAPLGVCFPNSFNPDGSVSTYQYWDFSTENGHSGPNGPGGLNNLYGFDSLDACLACYTNKCSEGGPSGVSS